MSLIGAMFASRPDLVAGELTRVCAPGGTIAMANWTAEGVVRKRAGHDERRRIRKDDRLLEHVLPRTRLQVALGDDHIELPLLQNCERRTRHPVNGFAGEYVQNAASMVWSASCAGLMYQSGREDTSISVFGQVGYERNGVFFPQGS